MLQADIFHSISSCFERWIERKGPEVMQFFPHAVAFLALTAIICAALVRLQCRSSLLFGSALIVSFLLAGFISAPEVVTTTPTQQAVIIALCLLVCGVAPVFIARMAGRGRLSRGCIILMLYALLFILLILNFVV